MDNSDIDGVPLDEEIAAKILEISCNLGSNNLDSIIRSMPQPKIQYVVQDQQNVIISELRSANMQLEAAVKKNESELKKSKTITAVSLIFTGIMTLIMIFQTIRQ